MPYMLRLRDIVFKPYLSNKSIMLSKSLTNVYVGGGGGGGGGGLFYCTTTTASLMKEVLLSLGHQRKLHDQVYIG